jgi:UDP-3-O-[3-hydroxymyristoyl] glucosamine N-acyltransferase
LVVYACLVGCEAGWQAPGAGEEGPDASFARASDTGALRLEATLETCPVGFDDIGLPHPEGAKTCVHPTATVLGTYDAGVVIGDRAVIDTRAHLGADSTLGAMAYLAAGAQVGSGSELGTAAVIGRNAHVGSGTVIGPDSVIGRSASVGSDVAALLGDLTLGYGASLGDRCVIDGSFVTLGNLASVGDDCRIGGQTVLARSATLGDGAILGADVVVGPEVSAGPDLTFSDGVRVRKGTTFGADVTVGADTTIGRDSVLGDSVQVGFGASLRSRVLVGARATVLDDAVIPRGTVIAGEPLDSVPPTIPPGQALSLVIPADPGATVGQVIATDDISAITGYAITSGDPGASTPYFSISSTGLVTLTAAGADGLRNSTVPLGIAVTDAEGNTGTATVDVTVTYDFVCEGSGQWLGYSDLTSGERVNLCVVYRATSTSPDRNTNVFTNPKVLTSCLSHTQFAEPFFRNTNGNPRWGAVRYERAHSPPLLPGSNISANFFKQTRYCTNGTCNSNALHSTSSSNSGYVYVPSVELCTISLDGYSLPNTSSLEQYRAAYTQFGSNARGLSNDRMGGLQSSNQTVSVVFYTAMRTRNNSGGSGYSASAGYSYLQMH